MAGVEFDGLEFRQHLQAEGQIPHLAVSFWVSVRGVLKSMSRKCGEMRYRLLTYLRGRDGVSPHGYRVAGISG